MASWDDVRRIALALPEVSEGSSYGNTAWKVRDKLFGPKTPEQKAAAEERAKKAKGERLKKAEQAIRSALNRGIIGPTQSIGPRPGVIFLHGHLDSFFFVLVIPAHDRLRHQLGIR